ncbi:MAG: mobilization protein [Oleiphilus sp.]
MITQNNSETHLKQREEKLKKQLALAKAEVAQRKRKLETRQKILIGAMILNDAEKSEVVKETLLKRLDGFLTRRSDRKLFGLNERRVS